MNTKRVQQTRIKHLWEFPPLIDGKQGRVMTKHYTNLSFLIPPNQFSLLSFLIYQSGADNVVRYSGNLLKMYQQAVVKGSNRYKSCNPYLVVTVAKSRENFIWLIEQGLLMPTDKEKEFLINPNLTFSKLYVKADFYKWWVNIYNTTDNTFSMAINYIEHVNKNFLNRKNKL